jgi:hypothetical protein
MKRIGSALDELRAAIEAANAEGFLFRLKYPAPTSEGTPGPGLAMDEMIRSRALETVIDKNAQPVLEYKATIQEAASA